MQHAPKATAHCSGTHVTPKPMNFIACCPHWYCVLITQTALASLQHPPLAHGFGAHPADAVHIPPAPH